MLPPETHSMTLPGPMLRRGFWLYVWRVQTPIGEKLYVGRTGDNSSPHASAPYTRMSQHLGFAKNQNALRRQLEGRSIKPEDCDSFDLIAHGPIFREVSGHGELDRSDLMALHKPLRNVVGAMERELASALKVAGYDVLNTASWRHPHDEKLWSSIRSEFAAHFPKLLETTA